MNAIIAGVYKIVNVINQKFYIGNTKDFNHRWEDEHKYFLNKNKHINPHLQHAWNEYEEIRLNMNTPKETIDFYLIKLKENSVNN